MYRGNRWVGERPGRWLPMGVCRFSVLTGNRRYVMRAMPFRGIGVVEVRSWAWGPGNYDDRLIERRERCSVKKVKVADRATVKHLAALESEMFREHLPIIECLAMLQYNDGSPREPGYLGMWTQGATWFVRVTDKTGEAQMTAEGRTAEEAWDTLSVLLGSEQPPWEPTSRRKKKPS